MRTCQQEQKQKNDQRQWVQQRRQWRRIKKSSQIHSGCMPSERCDAYFNDDGVNDNNGDCNMIVCPFYRNSSNVNDSLTGSHYSYTTSTTSPITTVTTNNVTCNSAVSSSWREEAHWLSFRCEVLRFLGGNDDDSRGEETENDALSQFAKDVGRKNCTKLLKTQLKKKSKHQTGVFQTKSTAKGVTKYAGDEKTLFSSSPSPSSNISNRKIQEQNQRHQHHKSACYHDSDRDRLVYLHHNDEQYKEDSTKFQQQYSSPSSNSTQSQQKQKQEYQKEEEELSKHIAEVKLELAMLRAQRDEMEFDLWKD